MRAPKYFGTEVTPNRVTCDECGLDTVVEITLERRTGATTGYSNVKHLKAECEGRLTFSTKLREQETASAGP